jgi:DNA-binding NarL/FixJ family response regulator
MPTNKSRLLARSTRIVIVDDHPMMRSGLATWISDEPDLEVCAEASDIDEALRVIEATAPHLAVVDISLKSGNGIDLIKRLRERDNPVRVLVCSMYDESLYADRALRAGAMGYVNKGVSPETIIQAIRKILDGEVYVSPEMSQVLLNRMVRGKKGVAESPTETLSDRELEAFQLMGKGLNTQQIADTMKLSPKTIETYRARIKGKLRVDTMPELTREAAQWVLENG